MVGTDLFSLLFSQLLSIAAGFGQTIFRLVSSAVIQFLLDFVFGSTSM
jgi:hypothetical protein